MTLHKYMEKLNRFIQENPGALEMEVVISPTDRYDTFARVYFDPLHIKYHDGYYYDTLDKNLPEGAIDVVCVN